MKKWLVFLLCWFPLVVWISTRLAFWIMFTIHCGGNMERASAANSIDLAKQEMEIVVKYAEDNGLTTGNTSILWNTPYNDVGFWYNNMKVSLEELRSVKPEASGLEKSNILMKLRETLLRQGDKGTDIMIPSGISVFPHNIAYAVLGVFSLIHFPAICHCWL